MLFTASILELMERVEASDVASVSGSPCKNQIEEEYIGVDYWAMCVSGLVNFLFFFSMLRYNVLLFIVVDSCV